MSSGLEKLRSIGVQKIHEQTHIARHHVKALLHESFDNISRVHFLGFISILEREYGVDLSELKAKGEEFYTDETTEVEQDGKVFVTLKKKKNYKYHSYYLEKFFVLCLNLNLSSTRTSFFLNCIFVPYISYSIPE